ncbi:hypothetical protein Nocox_05415 [Nonomuraea coxensis DSM 45129]|uniref:Uncharacterized protein n=1 Tax=Nonomuraea coxensis DSM 45129 TaxID=1122611 RepID=A0ABX8TTB6_9ACTN|nr:hypothetical protein [Nonomuraea coxensis]QYC38710.1 hypothetical protein Nocox_05415 [Nonomuraea coxensis DSM 45129]
MTTPPHQPPNLVVPGQTSVPQGDQRLYLAGRNNAVTGSVQVKPAAAAVRSDPGFFKRLVTGLNPLRQSTRAAMAMSGLGAAALALDVAATLNLGNPFLFYDRRETWKEMSGALEGNRSNLWRGYFDQISPNWKGTAAEALQQYVRFNVNGLFSQLGKVGDELSGAMHGQYKEVLEYDLSVFGLYATSAPVLRSLASMSTAHPVARVALMTQVGVFSTALGNLVKQFADIYNSYEGDLNKLELKLNDLKGAFYNSGDPTRGARDLHLSPTLADPGRADDMWKPKGAGA